MLHDHSNRNGDAGVRVEVDDPRSDVNLVEAEHETDYGGFRPGLVFKNFCPETQI
jgi:hypothetical protein